ncbi:MAG: site-2 protease family protein, partial [Clostridia bacterium]|nr:site-2 protease family protein [Clostridia bacterium]
MGDKTAKFNGRLSLNPLRHIDWFGFLMLIVAGIGWAKPVPVNMFRFKDPKKGMAITALAGPLMNILLVFVSLLLYALAIIYGWNEYLIMFFSLSAQYNAVLAMFNMLPIPPLDGSKVLFAFLPEKYYFKLMAYEQYGMILILILSFTNMTSKII